MNVDEFTYEFGFAERSFQRNEFGWSQPFWFFILNFEFFVQSNLFKLWKLRQRCSLTSQVESGSRVSKATIISMAFLPFSTIFFFFTCSLSFSLFCFLFLFLWSSPSFYFGGFFLLVVCCCVAAGSHSLASLGPTTWCPTANKNTRKRDGNLNLKWIWHWFLHSGDVLFERLKSIAVIARIVFLCLVTWTNSSLAWKFETWKSQWWPSLSLQSLNWVRLKMNWISGAISWCRKLIIFRLKQQTATIFMKKKKKKEREREREKKRPLLQWG